MPFALSLRLPLTVADAIALQQHLGLTHTTEFIRAVDPWCYPGDETLAAVVLKGCVQCLLSKSRDVVKIFSLFSEESKSAFLLSLILTKERPALIRKPQGKRGSSSTAAPPAPTAHVDLGVLPASDLLPACLVQLPAAPVAPVLPTPSHATPSPAAPLPPPSPGQFFDVGARVRVVANTTTGIAPVHATGLLFATVVNTNAAVSTPSKLQEVTVVRVGAGCRGNGWFPGDWMASVPYFEVMKDAAAPRRES